MKTVAKTALSSGLGLVVFVLLVFGPAGTFDYWQGWVLLGVFTASTLIPSGYLLGTNPAALERRMHSGPMAETRPVQKAVITVALVTMTAMIVVSALDHRHSWSEVPPAACLTGAALVAIGLCISMLVVIQNGYAAANITVEEGQTLVSTGLYRLVRHPMYLGNVILMLGIPPALGSYWGLLFVIPGLLVLALRIGDEERLLTSELAGYADYTRQVRCRLLPYVW